MNAPVRLPLSPCASQPLPPLPHPDARLGAALALVRGGTVADVGTDHAYLPVLLLRTGACSFAVATDIHKPPAQRAAQTLSLHGIGDDRAAVLLTDGLHGCEAFSPTDILILGMGGEMMIHILSEAPWVRRREIRLILQPMTRQSELRRYLASEGFATVEERIVQTDRPYQIICAEYDGTVRTVSPLGALLGDINLARADEITRQAAARQLEIFTAARQGKRLGGNADTAEEDAMIAALQQYLDKGVIS